MADVRLGRQGSLSTSCIKADGSTNETRRGFRMTCGGMVTSMMSHFRPGAGSYQDIALPVHRARGQGSGHKLNFLGWYAHNKHAWPLCSADVALLF